MCVECVLTLLLPVAYLQDKSCQCEWVTGNFGENGDQFVSSPLAKMVHQRFGLRTIRGAPKGPQEGLNYQPFTVLVSYCMVRCWRKTS